MTATRSSDLLHRLARGWRRRATVAIFAAGIGAGALIISLGVWTERSAWLTGPVWVLVVWGALALLAAGALVVLRIIVSATSAQHAAWLIEGDPAWRRGSLSQFLTPPAVGISDALLGAADTAAADRLVMQGPAALSRATSRWRPWLRGASALGLIGVAAFASSRPFSGPARQLWSPRRALAAAWAPVRIDVSDTSVGRGDSVRVTIEADERRTAILWVRTRGEEWRGIPVALDSMGRGEFTTAPLTSDLYLHATSGGRGSDTAQVRVRVPAFLGSLTVVAHYPSYLHLDPEPLPVDGDTVLLPVGAWIATTGEATAELGAGEWAGPEGAVPVRISGRRFTGDFTPSRSGDYRLALRGADGAELAGARSVIPVQLVADAAPEIELPVPGADTSVGSDLRVPLLLEARDDHGLSRVEIESSRAGGAPTTQVVPLPAGEPDHLVIPWTLDLNGRGFVPGDTVIVRARAFDNAPTPHASESREYRVRLVTLSETRAQADSASRAVQRSLDSLSTAATSAARQTADLAQERDRSASNGSASTSQALSYEASQRAAAAAEQARQLQGQAAKMRDAVASLERQAAAAGLDDPAWRAQLDEIRQELDRALTPELRQRVEDLERAVRDLDASRTRDALHDLASAQNDLRQALERSRELFRRAAVEGDLANLSAQATELAEGQRQWNAALSAGDTSRSAKQEAALAARTDSLATSLERVAPQLASTGRDSAVRDIAKEARSAAAAMEDAADAATKAQPGPAAEQGKAAEQRLSPIPQAIEDQRRGAQQQWREDVTAQLDRALAEMARLSGAELDLSNAVGAGDPAASLRERQAALEEGTQRVVDQLREASGKNALVSPQLAVAVTQALMQMGQSRAALATAVPDLGTSATRAGLAVDALNAAAYLLLRNRDEVAGSKSGSGLAEAMAKMRELAGQQGSLGEASAGILPLPGGGSAAEIRALGGRERAIAEQLERMRAEGQVPGAGELAAEAKALAQKLEGGALDRATVERQQKLFHRMLDAGRTLQGNEDDPDRPRVSQTAIGDTTLIPPPLPSGALGTTPRMPPWSDLQQYSPEERRLVADYFRRLVGGTP